MFQPTGGDCSISNFVSNRFSASSYDSPIPVMDLNGINRSLSTFFDKSNVGTFIFSNESGFED